MQDRQSEHDMYPKQTDLPKGLLSSLPKTPLYQGERGGNEE